MTDTQVEAKRIVNEWVRAGTPDAYAEVSRLAGLDRLQRKISNALMRQQKTDMKLVKDQKIDMATCKDATQGWNCAIKQAVLVIRTQEEK